MKAFVRTVPLFILLIASCFSETTEPAKQKHDGIGGYVSHEFGEDAQGYFFLACCDPNRPSDICYSYTTDNGNVIEIEVAGQTYRPAKRFVSETSEEGYDSDGNLRVFWDMRMSAQ